MSPSPQLKSELISTDNPVGVPNDPLKVAIPNIGLGHTLSFKNLEKHEDSNIFNEANQQVATSAFNVNSYPAQMAEYMYSGLGGTGDTSLKHQPDYHIKFTDIHGSYEGNGLDDLVNDKGITFKTLEEGRKRIYDAFAILDVNHLVNDNNRNLMLKWMADETKDGYLARANYSIAISNVYDMRETYFKTQQKIKDMTRLGEVQTYYKLYYGAKKKIILETIVVVLALIVLYALRRNDILADGLFNLFFVIILFAYIFFRLSWQIVDFMSRDRRYFDKYDWGEIDGSYNFYEFKDVSPEVVINNKRRVTKCLDRFFKSLEGHNMDYPTFENVMCGYIYLAEEDYEEHKDGIPLHLKMLWVVIYQVLHYKYYANTDCTKLVFKGQVRPLEKEKEPDACIITEEVKDEIEESSDKDVKSAIKRCKTIKDGLKKSIIEDIDINVANKPNVNTTYKYIYTYENKDNEVGDTTENKRKNEKYDVKGVIRRIRLLHQLYDKVHEINKLVVKKQHNNAFGSDLALSNVSFIDNPSEGNNIRMAKNYTDSNIQKWAECKD